MNRRRFLKVMGGAGLAVPGLIGVSSCSRQIFNPDTGTDLSLGYVSGDVSVDSALVWLQAVAGSRVVLHYGREPGLAQFQTTPARAVDAGADHSAIFSLDGLEPATRYYYRAMAQGRTAGPVASFVTAPRADDNAKVTFCFSGDTRQGYKPFTIMNAVRAQRPDFFLNLGDTIYADRNGAARSLEEFWDKYRINRDDAAAQSCFAETSVYAIWDDHEVEDNYLPGHPLAPIGRKAFLDYWPVRGAASEPEQIYRAARWGRAVDLLVLDTRQYRAPDRSTMLGRRQKDWFFDRLVNSTATFKFVATTVPMAGGGQDRWDGYPKERAEILRYIRQKKIPGVVFMSADMHYAAVTRIPKGNGLIDITAGPLAAQLNRVTNSANSRYEFFLAENFNFAKITVDPKVNGNEALLEFIDQDNRVFYTRKIRA
ncbi:MAG: alkaline phosphatase D family protein [Candidatus Binatia bacterium]